MTVEPASTKYTKSLLKASGTESRCPKLLEMMLQDEGFGLLYLGGTHGPGTAVHGRRNGHGHGPLTEGDPA